MDIYNIKSTDIVHSTSVDLISRVGAADVHIVQYDNTQPIIAVKLFKDLKRFCLPEGYEANIRWSKPDSTFVYKKVLGCNSDRNIVYFAVDEQMALIEGKIGPIVELTCAGTVVGSSPISVIIDRNPIQIDDIESQSDYPAIMERLGEAEEKATNAETIAKGIAGSITEETNARKAADNQIESNKVTTNTNQTITGEKFIEGNTIFNGHITFNKSLSFYDEVGFSKTPHTEATPTYDTAITNKKYVDNAVKSVFSATSSKVKPSE